MHRVLLLVLLAVLVPFGQGVLCDGVLVPFGQGVLCDGGAPLSNVDVGHPVHGLHATQILHKGHAVVAGQPPLLRLARSNVEQVDDGNKRHGGRDGPGGRG